MKKIIFAMIMCFTTSVFAGKGQSKKSSSDEILNTIGDFFDTHLVKGGGCLPTTNYCLATGVENIGEREDRFERYIEDGVLDMFVFHYENYGFTSCEVVAKEALASDGTIISYDAIYCYKPE